MVTPRLGVVILNFKTPLVTIDCLESLASQVSRGSGIIVVLLDNASGDGSVEMIRAHAMAKGWLDDWLQLRVSETNLGFAGGNNLVLNEFLYQDPSPEFLLLLNSDTIVGEHCLAGCLDIMAHHPRAGAMSCLLLNQDGSVQNTCRLFPRPDREIARAFGLPWILPALFGWADLEDSGWDRKSRSRDVEWIGGAFMMLRTQALKEGGVFDPRFFFLGEDCELCFRLSCQGWSILYDPSFSIIHLGGASLPKFHDRIGEREKLIWTTRCLLQRVCYGSWAEKLLIFSHLSMLSLRLFLMWLSGASSSPKANLVSSEISLLRLLWRSQSSQDER